MRPPVSFKRDQYQNGQMNYFMQSFEYCCSLPVLPVLYWMILFRKFQAKHITFGCPQPNNIWMLSYVETVIGKPTVEPITDVRWYTLFSWTEGGRRITDERKSFKENEMVISSARPRGNNSRFAWYCSPASRLIETSKIPEVMTKRTIGTFEGSADCWIATWSFFTESAW